MTRPWWITAMEIVVYMFCGAVVLMGVYLWTEERSSKRGGR